VKAERRVEDAARWRLAIGEPLLAGGFTWIATPRPQISLLFLARRAHFIALTDRRIMIWARPHEVRPPDDTDLVLDAPFADVVLVGMRTSLPMLQLRIRTSSGRQLVLEFRPSDRKLGRRIAQELPRELPAAEPPAPESGVPATTSR
jgi:hypothetical protein